MKGAVVRPSTLDTLEHYCIESKKEAAAVILCAAFHVEFGNPRVSKKSRQGISFFCFVILLGSFVFIILASVEK